jgi:hypothetical protein
MKTLIESFTPYRASVMWRIHEAYYAQRGVAAWSEGDIPFRATSNRGAARQCAEWLLDRFGAGGEVSLLEVGGGNGSFAANLLGVLESECGPRGAALFARLRYVYSDYSERNLAQAAGGALARFVASGRVVPALFDLRRGGRPCALDGAPLGGPFDGAIANYVACVLPTTFLQRRGDCWDELYAQLTLDDESAPASADELVAAYREGTFGCALFKRCTIDYEWRPAALEDVFADPVHAEVARQSLPGDGVMAHPYGFLDFLRGAVGWLAPDGFVLACDYGTPIEQVAVVPTPRPSFYGDSLSHAVQLGVIEAFAAGRGWEAARTEDPLQPVHHLLLARGRLAPEERAAFRRHYVQRHDGADLLDFSDAARAFGAQGEHQRAARFYARCLRIDPGSVSLRHEMGQACMHAGRPDVAVDHLVEGARLDVDALYDHHFQLGNAHYQLGRYHDALDCYHRSLTTGAHAATHWNLALTHRALGDVANTCRSLDAVLAIEPGHELALKMAEQIKRDLWQSARGGGDGEP